MPKGGGGRETERTKGKKKGRDDSLQGAKKEIFFKRVDKINPFAGNIELARPQKIKFQVSSINLAG